MKHKNAKLVQHLNLGIIILFLILLIIYIKLHKFPLFVSFLLFVCFLLYIILFIITEIVNNTDPNNNFKRNYNIFIISIVLFLSFTCLFFENYNSNSKFINFIIKPFSDFFGFIVIEDSVNTLLNERLKKEEGVPYPYLNEHKVYNNWHLFVNNIKKGIDKNEILKEKLPPRINFDSDYNDFIYFKLEDTAEKFINLLSIKEYTGYIIWMVIIIILLYYIK